MRGLGRDHNRSFDLPLVSAKWSCDGHRGISALDTWRESRRLLHHLRRLLSISDVFLQRGWYRQLLARVGSDAHGTRVFYYLFTIPHAGIKTLSDDTVHASLLSIVE
jgi:hypothetical protein